MGGPHGDRACQQMLWVHRWGNASSTGHLHIKRSLDLAAGSRETPRATGIAQKWDGSKLQMKGCATSKGSSTIRATFTDLPHHGGQLGGEGHL